MASKLKFKKSGTVYEAPLSTNKNAAAPAWIGIRDSVGVKYVAMWGLDSGKVKYPLRIRKGGVTYGAGDHTVATTFTIDLTSSGAQFIIPSDAYGIQVYYYLKGSGRGGTGGGGGGGGGGTLTVTGTGSSTYPGGCGGGGQGGQGGAGGSYVEGAIGASAGDKVVLDTIPYAGGASSGGIGGDKGGNVTRTAGGGVGDAGTGGAGGDTWCGFSNSAVATVYEGQSSTVRSAASAAGGATRGSSRSTSTGFDPQYGGTGGRGGHCNSYSASAGGNAINVMANSYSDAGAGGSAGAGVTNGITDTGDWRYSRGGDGGAGGRGQFNAGSTKGGNGGNGLTGTAGYGHIRITYTRDI